VKNTLIGVACALSASAVLSVPWDRALASDGPTATLEEVVVTARKREENLQNVPVSIEAIDTRELRIRSLETLSDVGQSTPNVFFGGGVQAGSAGNLVYIRGVGQADPLAAEVAARAAATQSGRTYVSPYNDPYVLAGQGTIGVELMRQAPDLDAIYIATGGGGLISGVGSYLKHAAPQAEIIGCWPENSPVLYECIRAGRIFDAPESKTLSESTAGGVEEGSITFDLCREVMHRGVLVTEEEILDAMRWGHAQGWAVEGASGVALAASFKERMPYADKKVVVLICGGNPSPAVAALLDP